jgi:hypothetical protein
MLFREDVLRGIAAGTVTLAFRRWRKAPPVPGATLRTPVGVVTFERIDVIDEGDITPDDLRRSGLSVEALRASLAGEGTLLRLEFRLSGDDPRLALRARPPGPAELREIATALARLDAAADGPWTARYLEIIGQRPATVARTLAAAVGAETAPFKRRVRRLKELGLTESLEVGYRLSPRGAAVLAAIEDRRNLGDDGAAGGLRG